MRILTTQSLHDVVEASEELTSYLDDVSLEQYLENRPLQLVTERLLEIIGEALSRIAKSEPEVLEDIPDSRSIIGMRNRISHGYDVIDNEIVWTSATYDVPQLAKQVNALLSKDRP